MQERRSSALDSWDWQTHFKELHPRWHLTLPVTDIDEQAAFRLAVEKLHLDTQLELLAHREVLANFSSDHLLVGDKPAKHVPVWAVIIAGIKHPNGAAPPGTELTNIASGGGVIVQALIHAETGEDLVAVAIPVELRRRN